MKTKMKCLVVIYLISFSPIYATKIPPEVKKSVAFVFIKNGSNQIVPQGTGFFVSIIDNQKNDSANFGYFVTAKHVIRREDKSYFDTIYIRVNKKMGHSDTIAISLIRNNAKQFFIHQDSTVDIAVIPLYPDQKIYDYLFVPMEMIAPIDIFQKENISEGDDVFFTGLFTSHIGFFKNIPVVRFGKIAQISDEKLFWDSAYTELYVIETTTYGGNSGSPLFFYLDPSRNLGSITVGLPKLYLAGLVLGYFGSAAQIGIIEVRNRVVWPYVNTGIAAVVPGFKLIEILNSTNAKQARKFELTRLKSAR